MGLKLLSEGQLAYPTGRPVLIVQSVRQKRFDLLPSQRIVVEVCLLHGSAHPTLGVDEDLADLARRSLYRWRARLTAGRCWRRLRFCLHYAESITNPNHSEYGEVLEWNGPFDLGQFDAAKATRPMKKGRSAW